MGLEYRCYMTQAGYALQAKLFAEGGDMTVTRVMVGGGVRPEGAEPSLLTDLVEPMAQATSTKPVRAGCEVSLVIEYRSDLSPELETPFQIKEFGVFALGADEEEALILWADLTLCPDTAVPLKYGGCVRRYPVNITVGPDATVSLAYPAGAWMTHEEAEAIIQAALDKGLDMGDGTTVGEAVGSIKNELDETKQDLKEQMDNFQQDVAGELDTVRRAVDGSSWYHAFELEDWTGNRLRISKAQHGMAPNQTACVFTLRQRIGRTAREYDEDTVGPVAADVVEMVAQALAANTAAAGSYPTAEDGHVLLTWEQVQYFLLDDILAPADQAAAKAAELGFGPWKDRDNGAAEVVTLDELLSAAYLPALGGPATAFNAMCSADAIRGLRFRRAVPGDGYAAKYDLDGLLTVTWGTMSCRVHWDMATKDLIVDSDGAFTGDILVMGPADVGPIESIPGVSMARSVDWANIRNKPDVALKSEVYPTEHFVFMGIVPDMESLPEVGAFVGEMYGVTARNYYYVWAGNGWDQAPYRAVFEHTEEDRDLLLKPPAETSQETES